MTSSDPCIKASELIQRGNVKAALEQVKRCKKQLRGQLQKIPQTHELINQQLVRVLRLESQIYTSQEKFSSALTSLEQADKILEKLVNSSENRLLHANISYSKGLIQMVMGDYKTSVQNFSTSMELFSDMKQYSEAGEIGFRLIELFSQQRDFESSLKMISSTEKLLKKDKSEEKKYNLIRLKILESKAIHRLGDHLNALKILDKTKKIAEKDKNYPSLLLIISEIADIHFKLSDLIRAEEYYLELHDMAVSTEIRKFEAMALMQLGIIALKTARLEEGKKRLLKGLQIRTELGDNVGTAQVLVELGRIGFLTSQSESDLEQASNFIRQALELYLESNYEFGIAQSRELLANIEIKMNNIDSAYKNINQSLKLYKKFNDRDGEGRVLTQLAIVLDLLNRRNEIDPVLNKAEKNFIQTQNDQGLAEVLNIKAQLTDDPILILDLLTRCRELYAKVIGTRTELQPILKSIDAKISELTNQ